MLLFMLMFFVFLATKSQNLENGNGQVISLRAESRQRPLLYFTPCDTNETLVSRVESDKPSTIFMIQSLRCDGMKGYIYSRSSIDQSDNYIGGSDISVTTSIKQLPDTEASTLKGMNEKGDVFLKGTVILFR